METRVLVINTRDESFELRSLDSASLVREGKGAYPFLAGEPLCHALLREDPEAMILAAGPLPFFPGNKLTVGYISPLTSCPHYSFVGGRAAAQLMALGLGVIVLKGEPTAAPADYIVVDGRVPEIEVHFKPAQALPRGQRSALYWLLERELGSAWQRGSILTIGDAGYHGYKSANLAVEGIYHAGRGGAGYVFGRKTRAMVLRADEGYQAQQALGRRTFHRFQRLMDRRISPLLEKHCARLGRPDTGTIIKLAATGKHPEGKNTLPARNAQQLGYAAAGLGAGKTLLATRDGHAACQWCEVRCRHWHWVPVDYAPDGRDAFLDDFEPTYSICAMLDLLPEQDGLAGLMNLAKKADRRLFVPIEQCGCDIMDLGLAIAALFEALERGLIPREDVPEFLHAQGSLFGNMDAAARVVEVLRDGAKDFPAIRSLGDGPQGLAARYPETQRLVFTCGSRTLGNAGHCNALWTFLMPFSRFFGHYSGQIYKIDEKLPPDPTGEEAREVYRRVIRRMIARELFCIVGNALSLCAFVANIFGEGENGEELNAPLLEEVLNLYGIELSAEEIRRRAEAFLARSIRFKSELGWRPPTVADYPERIFEAVSRSIGESESRCKQVFGLLIEEWQAQMGDLLRANGVDPAWQAKGQLS